MKKLIVKTVTSIVILICAGVTFVTTAQAQGKCNLQTVKGSYGALFNGPIIGFGSFAAVGVVTFDGNGVVSGTESASANGVPFSATFTGTYTLNQDCTGSITATFNPGNFEATLAMAVHENGKQAFVMQSNPPGTALTGIFKRLAEGTCNLETLKGDYAFLNTGTGFGVPIAGIGTMTLDGLGDLIGHGTTSFGGVVSNDTFTGHYTVTGSCTGTIAVTFTNGFTVPGDIVIVDNAKEIFLLATVPGEIATGTFSRQ